MIKSKSIVAETNPQEVFGLGVVDSHDVVHFIKLTKQQTDIMTHGQAGLPGSRDRFRYFNGVVGWTDTPSSKDVKFAVEEFLAKHKYPFIKHMGYFGDVVSESHLKLIIKEIIKTYQTMNEQVSSLKFWWLDPKLKLHPVKFEEHRYWAEAYLKKIGYDITPNSDVYNMMYRLGFIRVVRQQYGATMTLNYTHEKGKPISMRQMKELKDLAIEQECHYLTDDTTGHEIPLLESLNETTIEKEQEVKKYLSHMNDDTMVVTVNKFDEMPQASYVQVDGFLNGQNIFSSNPEDLMKWGFSIPSTKQFLTLPTGRYKLGDAKTKLRQSLKEAREKFSKDGMRRWWMDNKGKLYDVSELGHSAWGAQFIINKLGPDSPHSKAVKEDYNMPYQILFGAGWIRLLFMPDDKVLFYEYNKEPNSSLKSKITKLARDLKANGMYDETKQKADVFESNLSEDMSYEELLKLTTPERKERASNVTARSLPVSVEDGLEQWNFRYKSSPATTVTDKPFRGSITFLKGKVGNNDNAMKMKCKVDCECPDFMYRFAYNDAAKGASQVGPDSLNGAINRRPKPAYDYGEGLCKHLIALGRFLKTKIAATRKSNLFEAIDDVAKQGPFNVTYYD